MIEAQPADNAVAIIAIVVAGIVGLVAPTITSIASWRRLTRELESESDRLTLTLNADQQRTREEAVREVLDRGAVLMSQYRSATSETKASSTPGHVEVSSRWYEVVEEVAAHRNRLRIWFTDEDEVVKAFDDFLAYANFYSEQRMKPSPNQDVILKGIEDDFWSHRDRYLVAARVELGGQPGSA